MLSITKQIINAIITQNGSFTAKNIAVDLPDLNKGTISGRLSDLKVIGALTMIKRGTYRQDWTDIKLRADGVACQDRAVPQGATARSQNILNFTPEFSVLLTHDKPDGRAVKQFMKQIKLLKKIGFKVEVD